MNEDPPGWRIRKAGDNVLFLVGFGSWTEDDARRFCREHRQAADGFSGRPWAQMGDASDWNLEDPSVQEILQDHNRRLVEAGWRAGAFYTGPGAMNRLLLYRLVEPDSDRFRFRVYARRLQAVTALTEDGFPVSESQLGGFFRGEGERV